MTRKKLKKNTKQMLVNEDNKAHTMIKGVLEILKILVNHSCQKTSGQQPVSLSLQLPEMTTINRMISMMNKTMMTMT